MIESDLFGHTKGSFTGATETKKGKFELADGGTLFLDEIGDMTLKTQAKVLKAVEEQSFQPIGAPAPVRVDVRVVAATNKNLNNEIAAGRFREDLYYRINVIEVNVPPLRDRGDDVLLLAHHVLGRLAAMLGVSEPTLTRTAQAALLGYRFPGNVRELENVLERALTLCADNEIDVDDLQLRTTHDEDEALAVESEGTLGSQLEHIERDAIVKALEQARYNKTAAAKLLGISFRALRYRIKKLGIE